MLRLRVSVPTSESAVNTPEAIQQWNPESEGALARRFPSDKLSQRLGVGASLHQSLQPGLPNALVQTLPFHHLEGIAPRPLAPIRRGVGEGIFRARKALEACLIRSALRMSITREGHGPVLGQSAWMGQRIEDV